LKSETSFSDLILSGSFVPASPINLCFGGLTTAQKNTKLV
jgi:hypothetical protein